MQGLILPVNESDTRGGAAVAARRLVVAQRAAGMDARMLVLAGAEAGPLGTRDRQGVGLAVACAAGGHEACARHRSGIGPGDRAIAGACADRRRWGDQGAAPGGVLHYDWLGAEMKAHAEAPCCGIPCVGFAIGGWPDIVRQPWQCTLVPPFDVSALVKALRQDWSDDHRPQMRSDAVAREGHNGVVRLHRALYGHMVEYSE